MQKTGPTQPAEDPNDNRIANKGDSIRDVPGVIGGLTEGLGEWVEDRFIDAQDVVDNMMGDNYTRDELVERQEEGQRYNEELTAELRADKSIQARAARGLVDIPRGALGAKIGAVETGLEAAEIIGDTIWTATLGNIFGTPDDQNPFSDKYDWASWNLGKDDIGAQTRGGKVLQGFLEFANIAKRLGGFGGMKNVGQQMKAAKQFGWQAQLGVASKAGFKGGVVGIGADMVMAASGEGNLSNLIKENAPEWYPTWMLALAVDEDDNPWEVALKSSAEGFGLGYAADGMLAYASGARAARRAAKEGKSVSEQEMAALHAADKILFHGTASKKHAQNIQQNGFKAKGHMTNLLGRGVYAAKIPVTPLHTG